MYYDDDRRPLKAPSVAPTATTHNPRSQNGSDGTDYTRHRMSLEPPMEVPSRKSADKPRPSFDRMRASMDRVRPSFEASRDFTSAAMLTRMESSQSFGPIRSKMSNFTDGSR
jgi:phospholipid-translocating ATPase